MHGEFEFACGRHSLSLLEGFHDALAEVALGLFLHDLFFGAHGLNGGGGGLVTAGGIFDDVGESRANGCCF